MYMLNVFIRSFKVNYVEIKWVDGRIRTEQARFASVLLYFNLC